MFFFIITNEGPRIENAAMTPISLMLAGKPYLSKLSLSFYGYKMFFMSLV